jgi:hypothetical protein
MGDWRHCTRRYYGQDAHDYSILWSISTWCVVVVRGGGEEDAGDHGAHADVPHDEAEALSAAEEEQQPQQCSGGWTPLTHSCL